MDILTLKETAERLGGIADNTKDYDEIVLTLGHVDRLTKDLPRGTPVAEFAGIKVFASPGVPDGYGVLRQKGKVVGFLNFIDGTCTMISSA